MALPPVAGTLELTTEGRADRSLGGRDLGDEVDDPARSRSSHGPDQAGLDLGGGRVERSGGRRRAPGSRRAAGTAQAGAWASGSTSRAAPGTIASRSDRPIASSRLVKPAAASSRRTSSAMAVKKRHDLLGRARELRAQVLALGGDSGRAGVEVALASHVAADRDQRRRPEAVLLGAEQRGDEDVPAGLQAAVGAQRRRRSRRRWRTRTWWASARPSSQGRPTDLIDDSGLAPVPPAWPRSGCSRRGPWRRRPRSCRRRARDQLDADPGARVDRAQVGDQLGQVLDRVDVVVRRRADHRRAPAGRGGARR